MFNWGQYVVIFANGKSSFDGTWFIHRILPYFGQNQESFQKNCNFLFPSFLPGNVQLLLYSATFFICHQSTFSLTHLGSNQKNVLCIKIVHKKPSYVYGNVLLKPLENTVNIYKTIWHTKYFQTHHPTYVNTLLPCIYPFKIASNPGWVMTIH